MHDLHEADKIMKVVLQHAEKNNLSKVTKIVIELGSVVEHGDEINQENLEANLKVLGENTLAEGAEILITKTKTDFWELKEIEGV